MDNDLRGEYDPAEITKELRDLNKILNITSVNSSKKSSSLKVSSTKKSKGVTGQTYLLNLSHKKTSKLKISKHSI